MRRAPARSERARDPERDLLRALDRLGKPLIIRSAYRSLAHNRAVGGAPKSKHLDGMAFDIAMASHDPVAFEAATPAVGFLGFGFCPRSGFTHIDLRSAAVASAGRLAEHLETMEKANDVQRQMLDAAARRPRDRDELADRLRDRWF